MSKQDRQVVRTAPELERKLGEKKRSSSSDPSGSDTHLEQLNQALQQYMNRTNAEIKNLKDNMGYLTPQIDITDIEGGHRITITDKDGTESFDVMDGTGGTTGTAADSEKLGGQLPEYYAKTNDLKNYVPSSKVGAARGVASLDENGKIPESQLPDTELPSHKHEIDDVKGLNNALNSKAESDHKHTTADISDFAAEMSKKADIVTVESAVENMATIAQGKCACYVFNTVEALDTWLSNAENTAKLKTGDVFLIRAVNVPDYWWDGDTASKQILETTKVDLTEIETALKNKAEKGHKHVASDVSGLANVATSGSYNDLKDKPSGYSHPTTHPASMITGLSTVATSGNYADLNGKPTIPTIPSSLPANGGNADTVDGYHIRKVTDTSDTGQTGYITFIV